nr:NfeD family protein [Massilia sp. IC2-278]
MAVAPACAQSRASAAGGAHGAAPAAAPAAASAPVAASAAVSVSLLTIDGPIGPAYADYVERGIARAAQERRALVVLQLDTPGGLDTAMRSTVRAILAAPLPVACYVAPSGARAASAGTYILYACHIAAMAPGTNLGAATPVQVGTGGPGTASQGTGGQGMASSSTASPGTASPGTGGPATAGPSTASPGPTGPGLPAAGKDKAPSAMEAKAVNDAAAYIRGLAQLRGRNADWAEKSVRQSLSLSAGDALAAGVIDIVARDLAQLLALADGRVVRVQNADWRVAVAGAGVLDAAPDWRTRFLAVIANPSVALILLTVGMYGLLFEFMSPGAVLPGVMGAICLLLGLYGMQLLPINYSGLALICFGLACMVAEAFLPSFGVIGLGGVVAFVIGALLLMDSEAPGFGMPLGFVASVGITAALLVGATAQVALRTRRRPAPGITAGLEGEMAEMLGDAVREGWANVGGETWRVVSDTPLRKRQRVRVIGRSGRVLRVVPADASASARAPPAN